MIDEANIVSLEITIKREQYKIKYFADNSTPYNGREIQQAQRKIAKSDDGLKREWNNCATNQQYLYANFVKTC